MPDVFVAFYDRHYRLVLTVAQQRLGGLTDAEDVTAEVFRIAWAHYQETGEITLPWVYQTLRHAIGNEYRRRSRAPWPVEDVELLDAAVEQSRGLLDGVVVRRELAALEEGDREVLFMAYWEDLSPREMGQILGVNAGTVRVRLFRARRRLQQRLEAASLTGVGEEA